jgi:hypothetical protein
LEISWGVLKFMQAGKRNDGWFSTFEDSWWGCSKPLLSAVVDSSCFLVLPNSQASNKASTVLIETDSYTKTELAQCFTCFCYQFTIDTESAWKIVIYSLSSCSPSIKPNLSRVNGIQTTVVDSDFFAKWTRKERTIVKHKTFHRQCEVIRLGQQASVMSATLQKQDQSTHVWIFVVDRSIDGKEMRALSR